MEWGQPPGLLERFSQLPSPYCNMGIPNMEVLSLCICVENYHLTFHLTTFKLGLRFGQGMRKLIPFPFSCGETSPEIEDLMEEMAVVNAGTPGQAPERLGSGNNLQCLKIIIISANIIYLHNPPRSDKNIYLS